MRSFVIFAFICLFAALTFFGLGPVAFADGTTQERILTLFVVIAFYTLLILALRLILRRLKS